MALFQSNCVAFLPVREDSIFVHYTRQREHFKGCIPNLTSLGGVHPIFICLVIIILLLLKRLWLEFFLFSFTS